jgi:quinol monooxygenase YgiN
MIRFAFSCSGATAMKRRAFIKTGGPALAFTMAESSAAAAPPNPVVRIAELKIAPEHLEAYTRAVRKEMDISVRVEPGVLAIYSVAEKADPTSLRFFEIYADDAAYQAHIASPHFREYFEITRHMITSRKLIETVPVQLSAKK